MIFRGTCFFKKIEEESFSTSLQAALYFNCFGRSADAESDEVTSDR